MLQIRATVRAAILVLGLSLMGYGQIVNSSGSAGGGGTVTSVTIAGTANQITATGTCTGTATITCTLSIPSAFVLPGTIDGLTITTTTGTLTVVNGKTLTVNKTLTLDGTDGVTLTFPATSATIARTDAGQTFIGTQVMTATLGSTSTATTQTAADNSTKLATTAYVDTGLATKGMTLISDQVLGSAAATVTFSSIPGTYRHLQLIVDSRCTAVRNNDAVYVQANGDSGANYTTQLGFIANTSAGGFQTVANATPQTAAIACASAPASMSGISTMTFSNYAGTAFFKNMSYAAGTVVGSSVSGNLVEYYGYWTWSSTSAITSLTLGLVTAANTFATGSRFTLYGL